MAGALGGDHHDTLEPLIGNARASRVPVPCRSVGGVVASALALSAAFLTGRESASFNHPAEAPMVLDAAPVIPLWQPKLNPAFADEPLGKAAVRKFDAYLMQEAAFADPETKLANVEQWLAPDFVYETVGFPTSKTPRGWCLGGEERGFRATFNESVFSQMLFFGSDTMATTTTYGNVFWSKPLFGIPATHSMVYFRVTDFYAARRISPTAGQLYYNFMMIDFADLLRRVGRPVLPKAELPEGFVMTAAADDGVPAPLSVVAKHQDMVLAEKVSQAALREDWEGDGPGAEAWDHNLTFYGPGGIGLARGTQQYRQHVLKPFRDAFADRKIEGKIFGCEGNYCGAFGELHGRHVGTWLGLKPSGKKLALKFAFHYHIVEGKVKEGWAIFDIPQLFTQLGLDFFAIARDSPLQV